MNAELEKMNAVLRTIEIRNPIRALINPKLDFVQRPDGIELSVRIDTIDVLSGNKIEGLEASFPLTPYLCGRYIRKPLDMGAFVHRSFCSFLEHEVSESVWYNGTHVIEPKHWGPTEEEMNAIREEIHDTP